MQKYSNVTTLSHTLFIHFGQQTTKQIANLAWIFIFVNEFSVKFAFVFVHDSCLFLLNSSFLPYFVTFYMSLLHVFDTFKCFSSLCVSLSTLKVCLPSLRVFVNFKKSLCRLRLSLSTIYSFLPSLRVLVYLWVSLSPLNIFLPSLHVFVRLCQL